MSYGNPSCEEEYADMCAADGAAQAEAEAYAAEADAMREMGVDETLDDVGCK